MQARFKYTKSLIIRTAACALGLVGGTTSAARAHDETPATDSASFDSAIASAFVEADTTLIAPHVMPVQIALPPTFAPAIASEPACGGREIGYIEPLLEDSIIGAAWEQAADESWVVRYELSSQDAEGLRIGFRAPIHLEDCELRLYVPGDVNAMGPYPLAVPEGEEEWWTPTIRSSQVGLEFRVPAAKEPPAELPPLDLIAYMYASESAIAELGCHEDLCSHTSWRDNEAKGVVRLFFNCAPMPGGGRTCSMCTGALLNRLPGDGVPLLMTANHCISDQNAAGSVEVYWFFQRPACGQAPTAPTVTNGALFLKSHGFYDTTILGLRQAPPAGAVYLGYNPGGWGYHDTVVGIHHPDGAYKRYSEGENFDSGIREFDGDDYSVWFVDYYLGTLEGGSSGSPLFDSQRRVRGPLTGGDVECDHEFAGYGRFDLAYPTLRPYLDPPNGVHVNWAHGGHEDGNAGSPFNTFEEASFCVRSGQDIWMTGGNYNMPTIMRRPMKIHGTGSVIRR